jgi:hypothetical protein
MAYSTPVHRDSIDLGDPSNASPSPAESQLHPRQPFRRQSSSLTPSIRYHQASSEDQDTGESIRSGTKQAEGLGITRVPVGSKDGISRVISTSAHSSPELRSGNISQATTYNNTPHEKGGTKAIGWEMSEDVQHSSQSFQPIPYSETSEREMLHGNRPQNTAVDTFGEFQCPTRRDILANAWSWLTISILLLALYSAVFSGIFLGIAIARPRWGKRIGTNGHMSFSTATLLSALFSKTIELSFVTVFVACLGQILSRKAFRKTAWNGGISIAEMSMRTWIMQPGTLITHWEAVRYAAVSTLGAIALIAALVATFYTTAAEALVAPKLKTGPLEARVLGGQVTAAFANSVWLANNCQTPIQSNVDPQAAGTTCLQVEHAGQGFHNFLSFLDVWTENIATGNTSATQYAGRPAPIANLFDNTTVVGQWITPSHENITADSLKHKRFVQNVTMAMPHTNVFHAVRDTINGILQPQDLQGDGGEYTVYASVPAPTVNILCAGVNESELDPLVYVKWRGSNGTFNVTTWATSPPANIPQLPDFPNSTILDNLFGFGSEFGEARQRAPIFPKYPLPYNTIVNGTAGAWPNNAIYILATPPAPIDTADTVDTVNYLLCSVRATQYRNCTTKYHAAETGGQLSVHCDDDPDNTIPYFKSEPLAPLGNWDPNWKDIGSTWANSLSLGAGISDGQASIARLLTQMIPMYSNWPPALDPSLPSIGEALGVLAGCTLLLSSEYAPFIHYWNYSTDYSSLQDPQYQTFNASLRYQDYASGGTQHWQGIFYIVLWTAFLMNAFCLVYLIWRFRGDGQVTDYTEPQNLFALAINSPPSTSLSGACGAGPEGHVLARKWQVDMQRPSENRGEHPHFYMKCPDDQHLAAFRRIKEKKSKRSLRSVEYYDITESPAVDQYMKLAGKWNTIS